MSPDGERSAYYKAGFDRSYPSWNPSIHMPRWASRVTLEIVNIRAERLQEISAEDIFKEGVQAKECIVGCNGYGGVHNEEFEERYFFLQKINMKALRQK
ncbi:MAG: hypothetical protein HQL63_16225 [Magnetococcales bacterium]|nr:hypothetical protein [Magnetococcales bacterium]MBF0323306.1 hypothetical protein [Magnetococcales bacterium]